MFAPHVARPERRFFWDAWRGTLRLLRPLGAVSLGNEIRVLADGDEAFLAMWAEIARAERSVVLNTYTLEDDRVGRRTLDELLTARQRGCEVTLIYDGVGSHRLGEELLKPLREAGATVLEYNPVHLLPLLFGRVRLVRNHWKILVVDGRVGFCGGMNISEDYAGLRFGNGLFRDCHLRVVGPGAHDLADLLRHLVLELTRRLPAAEPAPEPAEDGALMQVLESNVRRQRRAIQRALRTTLYRAVERCYLTSPYFVPPLLLVRALCAAAQRGVDVRILTAGRSDVPLVHLASQHLYGRLLRAGVRIYEMTEQTLHAKTATIDGVYASVGSFNLDYWSYRRNLEVTVTVLDSEMADGIQTAFLADLELGREVVLERWEGRSPLQRVLHYLAYQLMRL